jgi:hypothetical protein
MGPLVGRVGPLNLCGRYGVNKICCLCRESNPGHPARSVVTIVTEISRQWCRPNLKPARSEDVDATCNEWVVCPAKVTKAV